jgi:hypothetical protein
MARGEKEPSGDRTLPSLIKRSDWWLARLWTSML